MARRAAIVSLCVLAALGVYGFWHGRLYEVVNWTPEGRARLLAFTALYWALAAALHSVARRLPRLNPAVVIVGATVVWTLWWSGPIPALAAAYVFGSCYFLGRLVAPKQSGVLQLVLGIALWVFVLWIALHFPVNRRSVYMVALAIPYVAAWKRGAITWPKLPRPSWGLYALLFFLSANWLIALKPEVSADGLSMHLALPLEVMRTHQWHFDVTRANWAVMPAAGDTLFTAAFLLGGETAARLANLGLLAAICAIIVGFARRWLDPSRASLSAALFASTPLAQFVTGSLFVENYWAAMTLGGSLLLIDGEVTVAAILLGSAVSAKLMAVVFVGAALPLGWKHYLGDPRRAVRAALLCTLVGALPYVFAAWKVHNPIFPFANNVFHSPYYYDDQPFSDSRYSGAAGWTAPFDLTFDSSRFIEGRPGAPGFQYFLLTIPALFAAWRKRTQAAALSLVGLAGLTALCVVLPNLRYMYAALPLLSIGIAAASAEFPSAWILVAALAALNLSFFTAAGWYDVRFALFDKNDVGPYLVTMAPERVLIPKLDPARAAAFFDCFGGDFAGHAYTNSWHQEAYWRQVRDAKSSAEVAAQFGQLGISQLLARADQESDFPVVETFLHEWAEPLGEPVGRLRAYKLRDTPAAYTPSPPVLTKGLYDDIDSRLAFKGAWYHDRQFADAAGHTLTYSDTAGASVFFRLDGTGFTWTFTKAPNRGRALVVVDGVELGTVVLHSSNVEWRQTAEFRGLANGRHSVEIRVVPGSPEASFIDVDQIDVY